MDETEQVITLKDDFQYWQISFNSNPWGSRTTKSLMQGSKWKIHPKNISYWVSKFWLSLCWINSNFRLLKEYFWSSRFLRTNGSFLLYIVCRSFNAWNKTNDLSKELSGGKLKLLNQTLKETIKNIVSYKATLNLDTKKENSFYHPQKFLEYQEFDSSLELRKKSDEFFLSGGLFSMQTNFDEMKPAVT